MRCARARAPDIKLHFNVTMSHFSLPTLDKSSPRKNREYYAIENSPRVFSVLGVSFVGHTHVTAVAHTCRSGRGLTQAPLATATYTPVYEYVLSLGGGAAGVERGPTAGQHPDLVRVRVRVNRLRA